MVKHQFVLQIETYLEKKTRKFHPDRNKGCKVGYAEDLFNRWKNVCRQIEDAATTVAAEAAEIGPAVDPTPAPEPAPEPTPAPAPAPTPASGEPSTALVVSGTEGVKDETPNVTPTPRIGVVEERDSRKQCTRDNDCSVEKRV